ncbi:DUF501 domain-containing protein [Alloscardovia sp. HMSC034E08]|uniref:DUF501 domain-containing protein n=1 Tax=Alloscardovia sp. HMSC034E08 TaxID=1739413 RepID=UPI0008C1B173|nr:DUF501 domain-containing protein [Alloscardovia sp. HMSC034E08]OFQ96761.1 hypothetical protein HMPREF2909_01290 [Alloscardovia sp. HMSC034E08]
MWPQHTYVSPQECAHYFLDNPATEEDMQAVEQQLGRYPRGMIAVGARCVCGLPLTTVTRPLVDGKIPFPTTFYLSHPGAVKAISHVEAAGRLTELTEQLKTDEELAAGYARAHEAFLAVRTALAESLGDSQEHIDGISAGGMPERVKCLHAILAQTLAMGPGVNPVGDLVMKEIAHEFDPNVCRCAH